MRLKINTYRACTQKLLVTSIFLFLVASLTISVCTFVYASNSNYELNIRWLTPSNSTQFVGDSFPLSVSANFTLNRWLDESGEGNNGMVYGAQMAYQRESGKAWGLDFNGVDDYVEVPNSESLNFTNGVTIEEIVKFNGIPNDVLGHDYYALMLKGHFGETPYGLLQAVSSESRSLIFYINGILAVSCDINAQNGVWYHLAATYDGTTATIYVNGIVKNSEQLKGSIDPNSENLLIGKQKGSTYQLNGSISLIRVYNRALNETEIKYSFEENTPLNSTGLTLDLTFKNLSWALERSEDAYNFVEVSKQSFDNLTINYCERQAGQYFYRAAFLGDNYYTGTFYSPICTVNIIQSQQLTLFQSPAKLITVSFALSVIASVAFITLRKKKA